MILIDDILVSDDVVEKKFICDLARCKGGCCEEGDAGAPLTEAELVELENNFQNIKPYLTEEGIKAIEEKGFYHYSEEFGWVTTAIAGKMCAYGFRDENGIIKCGIEKAFIEGKINWKKPISCHLFPIKIKATDTHTLVNYEPRKDLCKPACALGEQMKTPAYRFLKEALVRKFGEDFYEALDKIANTYYGKKEINS